MKIDIQFKNADPPQFITTEIDIQPLVCDREDISWRLELPEYDEATEAASPTLLELSDKMDYAEYFALKSDLSVQLKQEKFSEFVKSGGPCIESSMIEIILLL